MKHKNIYRISISLLLAFVMALPTIAQNTKTFKGVVLDETEQPIIGAAIKVVGTTVGTITDLDGNFTLNVPDGKEVEISYIGYVPQRFSAPFKLTKIILKEDTQQLDEVVVVGYGTQKKAHLTGAIATVPVDLCNRNLFHLQGKDCLYYPVQKKDKNLNEYYLGQNLNKISRSLDSDNHRTR